MSKNMTNMPCAIILTAHPVEYREVCAHVTNLQREIETPSGTAYLRGIFTASGHSWNIGLVAVGTGNLGSGLEVEHAISRFKPDLILFVGVANALKDVVAVGDVVAATKVYDYECDQSVEDFQARPAVVYSAYQMVQRAQAEACEKDWLNFIRYPQPVVEPKVFVAPIVARENVVYPTDYSEDCYFLQASYPDAVALEREGSNFLQAMQTYYHRRNTLIVRSIVSTAGDKSEPTRDNLHLAARHASAFTFGILAKMASAYPTRRSKSSSLLAPELQTASPVKSIEIFYSYAREDEKFVKTLQSHLFTLKRLGLITDWYAGRITPGEKRKEQVEQRLNSADIILLLISPDFINSEDLYRARTLEKRQRANGTIVIPVLLRPTEGWQQYLVPGNLQSLPRSGKAITEFSDPRTALAEVVREIRSVIEKLRSVVST